MADESNLTPAQLQLRAAAQKSRSKSQNHIPREVIAGHVVEFLNSDETEAMNVENWFNAGTPLGNVASRIKTILKEDGLSELAWPVKMTDGVHLVKTA